MPRSFMLSLAAPLSLAAAVSLFAAPAAAEPARDHLARITQSGPAGLKLAQDAGRKAAFFCANCHGETGVSKYPEVPNLAGQHPVYVLGQIEAFLSGRRKDAFMQGLMKVLSEEEKAQIALFFAAQPVPPAKAVAVVGEGKELFSRNCARCHGAEAKGGETFPRLAGQQDEYLRRSLQRYLKASGERIYPPMTAAVNGLGEKNIEAVVNYLSSQP
ncbi:c-type cytochrome [Zoogloea dura]|jgi:cytochrome c553|uniref:C-type cytochrome n=1 Tax=Zoogloea dura TaxID=2728840 RepID=A0A848G762_9RHOO|nr:c-type cytochrome [Zoogloea dura]NML27209.1 c-type cytochrome [Zoogloea dura]